jgi:hypothetical protein
MGYETGDAADRYWHRLPVGPHFFWINRTWRNLFQVRSCYQSSVGSDGATVPTQGEPQEGRSIGWAAIVYTTVCCSGKRNQAHLAHPLALPMSVGAEQ